MELQKLIEQEKSLQERTERIVQEENEKNQLGLVFSALPMQKEVKSVIAQIEFISNKDKITLASISAEDKSDGTIPSAVAGVPDSGGYKTINGTIEVSGGYGQLKQLIRSLWKLERIVNITKISVNNVSSGGEQGSLGRYSVNFKSYWQPEITEQMVKEGLESKEVNPSAITAPLVP
ncbi:MAG: type 4a pilus biogenesis protein PilO [Candidatus Falkowbacteria bacterium]|nr:type 4a pilus biogenesis protein PilO [Candidatus Falkowbacteria bacterium]